MKRLIENSTNVEEKKQKPWQHDLQSEQKKQKPRQHDQQLITSKKQGLLGPHTHTRKHTQTRTRTYRHTHTHTHARTRTHTKQEQPHHDQLSLSLFSYSLSVSLSLSLSLFPIIFPCWSYRATFYVRGNAMNRGGHLQELVNYKLISAHTPVRGGFATRPAGRIATGTGKIFFMTLLARDSLVCLCRLRCSTNHDCKESGQLP